MSEPVPEPGREGLISRRIVGSRVDATSYGDASDRVMAWARAAEARYVCVANVHMVMEAADDAAFHRILEASDLTVPDGFPLVWALRRLGVAHATRVRGPELTAVLCQRAAREGVPVGFYGASPQVLDDLLLRLRATIPELRIAYRWSPPFRDLSGEEAAEVARQIRDSGARLLFVGLGCPKQERWMFAHRAVVPAVALGVGAAFDFLAGHKPEAPAWMQRVGLEWLHRLATEPRRLWRRYLRHNPRFVVRLSLQLARERSRARGS